MKKNKESHTHYPWLEGYEANFGNRFNLRILSILEKTLAKNLRSLSKSTAALATILLFAYPTFGYELSLSWNDNSQDELGFEIERSFDGQTFEFLGETPENVNSYIDTDVDADQEYYYRVRAYNSYGASGYSNVAYSSGATGTQPTFDIGKYGVSELFDSNLSEIGDAGKVLEYDREVVGAATIESISGTGLGIDDFADEGAYGYTLVSGETRMVIRLDQLAELEPNGELALMVREDLDPRSKQASIVYTADHVIRALWRAEYGKAIESRNSPFVDASSPCYLAIESKGGFVTLSYSCGGNDWWTATQVPVRFDEPYLVGIWISSGGTAIESSASYEIVSTNGFDYAPSTLLRNLAPVAKASLRGISILPGDTIEQTIPADAFVDPEGQSVKYSIPNLPLWMSFDGSVLRGVATDAHASSQYVLKVVATDPEGASSEAYLMVAVGKVDIVEQPDSGDAIPSQVFKRNITINAHSGDREVRDDGSLQWSGNSTLRIGGASGNTDGAAVIPFRIPELAENERIAGAAFSANLNWIANKPVGAIDLYGIGYRSSYSVNPSDYYDGDFGGDGDAWAIQAKFATSSSSTGRLTTNGSVSEILASFINEQIDQGAKAGDYIFLRLNPSIANEESYRFWVIASADSSNNPMLELTVNEIVQTSDSSSLESSTDDTVLNDANLILDPLPEQKGWKDQVIGSPRNAGEYLFYSGDDLHLVSVSGTGYDGNSDQMRYHYQVLNGNVQMILEVHAFDAASSNSQVGLMLRNDLSPDAPHMSIGIDGSGKVLTTERTLAGEPSTKSILATAGDPFLVAIDKVGDMVTLSYSVNGEAWVVAGTGSVNATDNYLLGIALGAASTDTLSGAVVEVLSLD